MAFKDKARESIYKNNFAAAKYDRLVVLSKKEAGESIRQAAAAAGQSVSAYILQAVADRMQRDATSPADAPPSTEH